VRTIDAAMREKIQQACREQTGKLDERSAQDQAKDRDDDNNDPAADKASVEINQKLRSSTDPEATLCRQSGVKRRQRYKNIESSTTLMRLSLQSKQPPASSMKRTS
jgi:hypothetical protein